jgi:uncharacterized protein (DUF1810 family)
LINFIEAQSSASAGFKTALNELKSGRKTSHWMWYIFPQLRGLGRSSTSYEFGIRDLHEAREYLNHEVLGPRLNEIVDELLKLETNNAVDIFGRTDSMKLCSCLTLFSTASDLDNNLFQKALDKYFNGQLDYKTLELLQV